MEVKSSNNKIVITGNIKSISHYYDILEELEKLRKIEQNIQIHIYNSISITSSVVGYLCKLVTTTELSLSLLIEDDSLYTLLDELNLIETLKVQKIKNI